MATTALNPAGPGPLELTAAASHEQSQLQGLIDRVNPLLGALQR